MRVLLGGLGLVSLLLPGIAQAQTLSHPLVPAGRVRLDFTPSVSSWDTRYGLTVDGEREEALGSDFTDPRGVSLFPGVVTLEEAVRALSGDPGFQAALGASEGRLSKEVTRIDMGLRLGVFDWLTLGVNVPYVKGRTTLDFAFQPSADANLGLNPAFAGTPNLSDLLTELGDAYLAAEARAQSVCASGGGEACQGATSLAGQANAFWKGLQGAYFASPFFLLDGSPAAVAMRGTLEALNGALSSAGLPGVTTPLVFASRRVDAAGFAALPGDPALGISGAPLEGEDGIWQLGDVELNATVRLLEGEARDSGAAAPRWAYGVYGGVLVRLGTGLVDDPDVFLDMGSGDGQMDIEGRLDAALRVGRRFGLRGGFRYGTQQSVNLVRRVAPHEALLPLLSSSRVVTWSPGAYTLAELSPQFQVTEALVLSADLRRFHKAEDLFEFPGEPVGEVLDPAVLGRETEVTMQEVAFGLRYSSLSLWRQGEVGTPAEVGFRVVQPLSGSGGQVPKATRVEFSVSLFRRLWG